MAMSSLIPFILVAIAATPAHGDFCPLGYRNARYRSYSDCVSSLGRYGPLAFLKYTCMPCIWGKTEETLENRPSVQTTSFASVNETLIEVTFDNKASSMGRSLYIARGSSSCWGIPGLAPQMDGSWNAVPDEKNTACPTSAEGFDYSA